MLGTEWGHDGLCYRRSSNLGQHHAQLNFPIDSTRNDYYIQLCEGFFPKELLEIIIDKVNEKIEGEKLSYGEFLQWIGVWILISTVDGTDCHWFWSTKEVDPFKGAPFCVTFFISHRRFENILINLGYTKNAPPPFRDRFLEVREMLSLWNKNMGTQFSSVANCGHLATSTMMQDVLTLTSIGPLTCEMVRIDQQIWATRNLMNMVRLVVSSSD